MLSKLSQSTTDEIVEKLADYGVSKMERMKKRVEGELVETRRLITFNRTNLPSLIKMTESHHEIVELYIPTPLPKSQRLRHTKNRCSRECETCVRCGS